MYNIHIYHQIPQHKKRSSSQDENYCEYQATVIVVSVYRIQWLLMLYSCIGSYNPVAIDAV